LKYINKLISSADENDVGSCHPICLSEMYARSTRSLILIVNTNRFELNINRLRKRFQKSRLNCKLSRDRIGCYLLILSEIVLATFKNVCVCTHRIFVIVISLATASTSSEHIGFLLHGASARRSAQRNLSKRAASALFSFHRLSFVTKTTCEIRKS
jgi:hypothetical protein